MSVLEVKLTGKNSEKLSVLARQTGKTPEELANDAVEKFVASEEADEAEKFRLWREALLQIEGMWADRDDLPDFAEIRKGWDRNLWER